MLKIIFLSFYRATVKLVDDGGLAIASNVALSLLLALFPFLMLIASLVRLYGDPSMAQQIVVLILGSWPGDSADAIIGHAGIGTIITALQLAKPLLVMPRQGALRETRNDHQLATARRFCNFPSVHVAQDEHDLQRWLSR